MTAMRKKVIITDRMQRGYVYWRTEPVGRNFAPGFMPTTPGRFDAGGRSRGTWGRF